MGMSASQARLLSITARLADTELQGQQIANAKIRLASESDSVSQAYLEALQGNKSQTTTTSSVTYKEMYRATNLEDLLADGIYVRNNDGTRASNADNATDEQKALWKELQGSANYALTNRLFNTSSTDDSHLTLQRYNASTQQYEDISPNSTASIVEKTDTSDIAATEADYNAKLTSINNKEKILDMQLNKIDTEHQALQTEYDSVKKVIEKNIERSFKIFS